MWATRCHKPTMTGNGETIPPIKIGDDLAMVYGIGFSTTIPMKPWQRFEATIKVAHMIVRYPLVN